MGVLSRSLLKLFSLALALLGTAQISAAQSTGEVIPGAVEAPAGGPTYTITSGTIANFAGRSSSTSPAPNRVLNAVAGLPVAGGFSQASPYTVYSGFWRPTLAPTAASVTISGRVLTSAGAGLRNATVVMRDSSGSIRTALTGPYGYFSFEDVQAGETYIFTVRSKRYTFNTRVLNVADPISDLQLVAVP